MKKLELWFPVSPWRLTQSFGQNKRDYASLGLNGHNGIDIGVLTGTEVMAAHDGIITFTGQDGAGGETIVVRTTEPFEYVGGEAYFKTIYCHLKTGSYRVKPGDNVLAGDVLALSNNTGWSFGDHLHFGLKPIEKGEEDWVWENVLQNNGYKGAIDPAPYFTGYFAKDKRQVISVMSALVGAMTQLLGKLKT
jgi:murein DD-endopeptidase MepM/ murein hydrolase activator NlpD